MIEIDVSYTPQDVGFDLRRHDLTITLGKARAVRYMLGNEERVVRGSAEEVLTALHAAGYKAQE